MEEILGKINSYESMGLVDGPGIRYVVFLQGCALRCQYCHNPDTWLEDKYTEVITPQKLIEKIKRFKPYFGSDGGVTFSGGEPLRQPKFLLECLKLCKENGIHTALDSAGVGFGNYDEILSLTDLVILDIKAVKEDEYKFITGQDMTRFKVFLDACQRLGTKLWLRQVIVPGINDDKQHMIALRDYIKTIKNVEKVELLPYKTIGVTKYKALKLPYSLDGVPDMDEKKCKELENFLLDELGFNN